MPLYLSVSNSYTVYFTIFVIPVIFPYSMTTVLVGAGGGGVDSGAVFAAPNSAANRHQEVIQLLGSIRF